MTQPVNIKTNNQQDINIAEPLSVRLKQLVDTYSKGNSSAFALLTGLKRTTLVQCMQKQAMPNGNFFAKIKNGLPDVDLNWLLNPADIYKNTSLGDKIWLVSEVDAAPGYSDSPLRREIELLKENNANLKDYNDMLKGQVEFLRSKLEKYEQSQ